MAIWVDADACPKAIRAIIHKAAERTRVKTVFVANHYIKTPPSRVISSLQVAQGFDVADTTILERMRPGDLVITADIPLAADVLAQNGTALNPRGTLYSDDNIKGLLRRRNSAELMRDQGLLSGGPAALDQSNIQEFANALDRFLAKRPSA